MAELAEFQKAAVDRIVERFRDTSGSGRFLLADEVGLGKTLVARGVVEALRDEKTRLGFTIVYVCSNSEIAEQNRSKLCPPEGSSTTAGRLTLLSLRSADVSRNRLQGKVQVFSFTPGTSLQIGQATGIKQERRLLMYLVMRVWGRHVNRKTWRDWFRCGAKVEHWEREASFRTIRKEFSRVIASAFQDRLRREWGDAQVELVDLQSGRKLPPAHLLACLDKCVDNYVEGNKYANRNRNLVIGCLRHGLARVALDFLAPELIILDEFQRFSDILDESNKEDSVVGKLFGANSSSVLILSATPYKMYTLEHEGADHHVDFMKTYGFLLDERDGSDGLLRMREMLREFRTRLDAGIWAQATDATMLELKQRIESELKRVMCRTERNVYLEGAHKGVCEVGAHLGEGLMPKEAEMVEYIRLRHFLLRQNIADWNITDFWKSSPSLLSFMDGHYSLIRRLRSTHSVVPTDLLKRPEELDGVGAENLKFRLLLDKVFGGSRVEPDGKNRWKFLWVRPTYTYYQDTFFEGEGPRKHLIFSHWKFVPKAISIVVSEEAGKRIGRRRKRKESAPLQFRQRASFYLFDVCYPSPVLASLINQLALCNKPGEELPADLYRRAEEKVKRLLLDAGIQIGERQSAPLWRAVARIESLSPVAEQVRKGLKSAKVISRGESSEHFETYVAQYLKWMDDKHTPITVSPRWLQRLTLIALYSPAVCVMRSVVSVFPDVGEELLEVFPLCLNQLRTFFNKPVVRTIIRGHGARSSRSYTEHVIGYCQKAHFQAVLDEYAHLLRSVLQRSTPKELLSHLGRVLGMWSGQPLVNHPTKTGRLSAKLASKTAHFALAFGDDVSAESFEMDGKNRRSAVRESFNSPFWPFVLATTSVGQEGLDFHLYCRDVVHWNLPSNPVDLEQREGRINRFDGLCIRQNIALDIPISAVPGIVNCNLWENIFAHLVALDPSISSLKHGLYPHWIYQKVGVSNDGIGGNEMIRRHLLFYAGSSDVERYEQLKRSLSFTGSCSVSLGSRDIVERIIARCSGQNAADIDREFAKYTINLSPLG